ncbi:hypothetical protein, partial [Mesorhizobium sp. B2-4-16]|uniref:hypothetical protein n=1 Tax=Mesorhizobium sp. B2-4-16 TaxID=2589933 RepID=UPI001AED6094
GGWRSRDDGQSPHLWGDVRQDRGGRCPANVNGRGDRVTLREISFLHSPPDWHDLSSFQMKRAGKDERAIRETGMDSGGSSMIPKSGNRVLEKIMIQQGCARLRHPHRTASMGHLR